MPFWSPTCLSRIRTGCASHRIPLGSGSPALGLTATVPEPQSPDRGQLTSCTTLRLRWRTSSWKTTLDVYAVPPLPPPPPPAPLTLDPPVIQASSPVQGCNRLRSPT